MTMGHYIDTVPTTTEGALLICHFGTADWIMTLLSRNELNEVNRRIVIVKCHEMTDARVLKLSLHLGHSGREAK